MAGLDNGTVIPAGFEAHHSPVCDRTMTATCTVTRLAAPTGLPTFDSQSGRSVYPSPSTVYSGTCRVQQRNAGLGGATVQEVGEKPQPVHHYRLSMPLAAPLLQVNDVVEILTATDAAMVGRKFCITDALGGTILWQRDYHAEEWLPTAR